MCLCCVYTKSMVSLAPLAAPRYSCELSYIGHGTLYTSLICKIVWIRGRKSSAYSHNMRRKIMANVGSHRKIKAKCCISQTKNLSNVFSPDLGLFSVSSILLVWLYFLSSVSQISKISSLPRLLADTILYG